MKDEKHMKLIKDRFKIKKRKSKIEQSKESSKLLATVKWVNCVPGNIVLCKSNGVFNAKIQWIMCI